MSSNRVDGDPLGESRALVAIQSVLASRLGVPGAARGLSHLGEHALGWMGIAAVGAVVDARRRELWIDAGVAAFTSHLASMVLKRVVRRPRPHDPAVRIGVGTPSKLSFPSSHATSTTAFAYAARPVLGPAGSGGLVGLMALSRLVLGVHYPSDVLAGAALGAATAAAMAPVRRRLFPSPPQGADAQ